MKEQEFVPNAPSSEEKYIAAFLKSIGIKFIPEFQTPRLSNDVKEFRRSDFYLPRLNIHVEYFGMYNSSKEKRQEYDLKAEIYIKNNLPSVFLYPHELGFLDYAFHSKTIKVLKLKKFYSRRRLFTYRLNRFMNKIGPSTLLLIFICFFYFFGYLIWKDFFLRLAVGALLAGMYGLFSLAVEIRQYFYKDL